MVISASVLQYDHATFLSEFEILPSASKELREGSTWLTEDTRDPT